MSFFVDGENARDGTIFGFRNCPWCRYLLEVVRGSVEMGRREATFLNPNMTHLYVLKRSSDLYSGV